MPDQPPLILYRAIAGSLLGTAVGDAMGLAYEGLSKKRVEKFLGGKLRYRFFFGRGFCSDDTEHTCMVAQALLTASGAHPDHFKRVFAVNLAWRLRFWLLGLPAGIGMATLKAIVKLWVFPTATQCGVFSAGNGPAMRSALIGVCIQDREVLRALVRSSTRMTHTDPRAEHGALAVALAARLAGERRDAEPARWFPHELSALFGEEGGELQELVRQAAQSALKGEEPQDFAATIGCGKGVSGYVLHTVPVALHAWFRHPHDYRMAIESVIRCGGDTDTVAAICGGIVGAGVGQEGIPGDWLENLREWPRTRDWLLMLADRLARSQGQGKLVGPMPLSIPALVIRNVLFMIVVLVHGFRRMLPPY